MDLNALISLLGGVAMFLFGMSIMGDSLKKVAGRRMEMVLYTLAGNPLKGVLLGAGVTAVIQSSSATSVMAVGFVNSGMMKVRQAIGIILGAVLGTSITGWILCLNSLGGSVSVFGTDTLTGIAALIGIVLWMFTKKPSSRNTGGVLLGFAVLMYGMSLMSGSIEPLREDPRFLEMFTSFSHPALGVLAGLLITAVIQSASAAVGILQALAVTGALSFEMAFPILMGIAIGASVPVMLSALGAGANGKRAAFAYLTICVLGALICGAVFYAANALFPFPFMERRMTMVTVALLNSLYRLAVVLVLAPATGLLEKIGHMMFPERGDEASERADMDRLEPRFITHPSLALSQSRAVIDSMAEKTLQSVAAAVGVRRQYDRAGLKRVYDLESTIDRYEDKLGSYLVQLISKEMREDQSQEINKYLRVLSDFERISDHARNIGEAVEEIADKKIVFTAEAARELATLEDAVSEIVALTIDAFVSDDVLKARRVEPLEEVIDGLCDALKAHHIERVSRQECKLEHGFVFNDMLTDYERISDHCSNVALDVIESRTGDVQSHEYIQSLDPSHNEFFLSSFNEYKARFSI